MTSGLTQEMGHGEGHGLTQSELSFPPGSMGSTGGHGPKKLITIQYCGPSWISAQVFTWTPFNVLASAFLESRILRIYLDKTSQTHGKKSWLQFRLQSTHVNFRVYETPLPIPFI